MLFRFCDVPMPISLDRLHELDRAAPGHWLAQPKLDGWRHVALRDPSGKWQHYSKHGKPSKIDPWLRAAFETLPWPEGVGFDCELLGPRHAGTRQSLHIFDLLYCGGAWIGDMPFYQRYEKLCAVWKWTFERHQVQMEDMADTYAQIVFDKPVPETATGAAKAARIKMTEGVAIAMLPVTRNPGLVDCFAQQLTNPFSEGLVIRSADQTNLGSYAACAENPFVLKAKFKQKEAAK